MILMFDLHLTSNFDLQTAVQPLVISEQDFNTRYGFSNTKILLKDTHKCYVEDFNV